MNAEYTARVSDQTIAAAKAGDARATDDLIRGYLPMLKSLAFGIAYNSFPEEFEKREYLSSVLLTYGMETVWTLVTKFDGDTESEFGGYLRETAKFVMYDARREELYGDDDKDGHKRFGQMLRVVREEHPALSFEEHVYLAQEAVTKLDPKRRLSTKKAEEVAAHYLTPLSIEHRADVDDDESSDALANDARMMSALGNPEESLFGNLHRDTKQIENMYRSAVRASAVRSVLRQMSVRSPRQALALETFYGVDGTPRCESDEEAAAYIESLGHAGVTARMVQKDRSRAHVTFGKRWEKGPEADDDVLSLALDMGLEDAPEVSYEMATPPAPESFAGPKFAHYRRWSRVFGPVHVG